MSFTFLADRLSLSTVFLFCIFLLTLSIHTNEGRHPIPIVGVGADPVFSIQGTKVYYNDGSAPPQWIVFNGIGLSCTQYMMKPNFNWDWAFNDCFGGPQSSANGDIVLNAEPANVLAFFQSDRFVRAPKIKKIAFKAPYDQVVEEDSPQHYPMIRLPTAASTYLYDEDCATGNHSTYVATLDAIIEFFTAHRIAVSFDMHMNCPDTTHLSGCPQLNAPMAAQTFGGKPGAVAFWDAVSAKYARNPYVFYELYNEPHLTHGEANFDIYYAGNSEYAGMRQMYDAVRSHDPTGIVIMGGMQQYATDAQTLLAFWLRYKEEHDGVFPTNILWNIHAYQGAGQGLAKALQSAMRLSLALKTIGPVIFTEFGQICCSNYTQITCLGQPGQCSNENTGQHYVYNMVNYFMQLDISWVGWAWRGTNSNTCQNQEPNCKVPDMRASDATLVRGLFGGANWTNVWDTFVSHDSPTVKDITHGKVLQPTEMEEAGYLPRPCILGNYNLGHFCGYDLDTDISQLTSSNFSAQNIYASLLPGLPPNGNCTLQGCQGVFECSHVEYPCKYNKLKHTL